jgi:hypothetical protein
MEVLWLLHHGLTQESAAQIVSIGVATVRRHVKAYRDGGLDDLQRWGKIGRSGAIEARRELLAESFRERPVSRVAEAALIQFGNLHERIAFLVFRKRPLVERLLLAAAVEPLEGQAYREAVIAEKHPRIAAYPEVLVMAHQFGLDRGCLLQ